MRSLPRRSPSPSRPQAVSEIEPAEEAAPAEQSWSAPTDEAIEPEPERRSCGAGLVRPDRRSRLSPSQHPSPLRQGSHGSPRPAKLRTCGRRAAWSAQIEEAEELPPAATDLSAEPGTRPRSPKPRAGELRRCSSQQSPRWSHRRQHRNSGKLTNPRRWRSRRPWRSRRNQPSRRGMTRATKPSRPHERRLLRHSRRPRNRSLPRRPSQPMGPQSAPPGKVVVSGQPVADSRAAAVSARTADDAGRPGRGLEAAPEAAGPPR